MVSRQCFMSFCVLPLSGVGAGSSGFTSEELWPTTERNRNSSNSSTHSFIDSSNSRTLSNQFTHSTLETGNTTASNDKEKDDLKDSAAQVNNSTQINNNSLADVSPQAISSTQTNIRANTSDVSSQAKSSIQTNIKANTSDVSSQAISSTQNNIKANTSDVNSQAKSSTQTNIKANTSDINSQTISPTQTTIKANTSDINSQTINPTQTNIKENSLTDVSTDASSITETGTDVENTSIKTNQNTSPTSWPDQMERLRRGSIITETVQTLAIAIPVVTIAVSVTGIALNVPSMLVFHMMSESVSNSYMKILILLDTVCLVANLPLAVLEFVNEVFIFLPLPYRYFSMYWGLCVLMGARHVVFVLTSFMSLHRCISLSFPVKTLPRNPLNHPNIMTCAVCLLGFTMSTAGLTFTFGEESVDRSASNTTFLYVPDLQPQLNEEVLLVSSVVFRTIPMSLILTSNLALFASLVRHARDTRAAGIDDMGTVRRRANMMRSVKMVVVYSVEFLVLALPIPIYPMVEAVQPQILVWEPLLPSFLRVVFPLLEGVSSSSNFFVFFAVSSAFMKGFRAIACKERTD